MNEVMEFMKGFDLHTIISTGIIMWYFTQDIKASIVNDRTDQDVRKMNSRLSQLEGTVYGKDVYKHIDPTNMCQGD